MRKNPAGLPAAISNVLMYLHISKFTRYVVAETEQRIGVLDMKPTPNAPEKIAA